jgi:tellurite resistance protein TehA-like permease
MGSEVVLPGILLLLAFFLKLSIDREVDMPNAIYAFLELPVDILFLATSFIAAFTIASDHPKSEQGFIYFVCYLFVAAIAVFLWRKACRLFEDGKIKTTLLLSTINYTICVASLIRAIQLV